LLGSGVHQQPDGEYALIRWGRTLAIAIAGIYAFLALREWASAFASPTFTDYLSYWTAGKFALSGSPATAYDVAAHRAFEISLVGVQGKMLPFPYPPPFLLLVTPFSVLPYAWSLIAWVIVTLIAFAIASRRVIDLPYAMSHPSVLVNALIGQNGFLTAAIFTQGTCLLRKRPFVGGGVLGILIIKPQLALLLPIAVVAARLWPAIAGALASSVAFLLLSVAFLGTNVFAGFLKMLPLYAEMMRQNTWSWNSFVSVFAFLRYFGVDQAIALTVHAVVAAAAAALTWIAWSRNWKEQVPILAAATLLIPPYLLTYDALLMIIPMGFWLKDEPRGRFAGLLWLLSSLPVAFYLNLYRGPNTVPLAAMVFLGITAADRLREKRLVTVNVDRAHLI
jgi:hypothetical protein